MDFVHMAERVQGNSKLLILTDKLSSFSNFFPAVSENAQVCAEAISDWISSYGVPAFLNSDKGPGFQNEVIQQIAEILRIEHHIISAEAHWSNGHQERLNGIIAKMFRKLLSENRMTEDRWQELIPIVQMNYNHSPTAALGGLAPVTVFTGLAHTSPMECFFDSSEKRWRKISIPDIASYIQVLQDTLRSQTIRVHELQSQAFYLRQAAHARKRNVRELKLVIGDFVMVRNPMEHKLSQRWIGPARVTEVFEGNLKYRIEFIGEKPKGTHRDGIYHASLLQFFDYATMVISPAIARQAQFYAQRTAVPEKLLNLRKQRKEFEVQVKWINDEDPTWEPLVAIHDYLPELVESFISDELPKLGSGKRHQSFVKSVKSFLGMDV